MTKSAITPSKVLPLMMIHKNFSLVVPLWLVLCAAAFGQGVNITMWQVDYYHTGNNSSESILTPANVGTPGSFGLLFTQTLDGQSYGQPLYVSNLTINSVSHNVVYVCTEHDSVYAFDADSNSGNNANPLWHDSLIPTGATTVPQGDVGSGDITVELGITTTPVIDTSTSTIYIVSKVKTTASPSRTDATGTYATNTYQQYLHALDLTTGAEKFNGPVLINPIFAGNSNIVANGVPERSAVGLNGPTVNANQVPFNALHEHTRAAMALYNGIVYISYASHSDTDPYHGLMIGYSAGTLQLNRWFITTPNGDKAGIWGGGAGPAFDSNGNIYISTGNGNFDQNPSAATSNTDWGESLVKLPSTGTGQFSANYSDKGLSYFTPYNQATLGDNDLGGGGILLIPPDQTGPHTHILVTGGKGSILYVLDRDTLSFVGTTGNPAANSGYNGSTDNDIQQITESNQMFMTPGYFNGNIYYSSGGGNLEQWAVGYNSVTGNYLTNRIASSDTDNVKGTGAFISSSGLANGVVWTCDGNLRAYNASNISGTAIFSGNITGGSTKFSLPIVANGKAYVAGLTSLNVYGLLQVATSAPAAASGLTAMTASSSQILLNWVDNSNNESGFKVMRASSSGGTYSLVTTVGANVTTYTDTNLTPKTTYYYKIIATNSAGDASPSNIISATTFTTYVAPGLVAYWPLDEDTGTVTADVTGNGHTGTLNGESEWTPGFINSCVDFHGTGFSPSNIIVPNSAAFQFTATQSFTVCAWINAAALRSSDEAIIAKSADQGNAYGIYINSANQWVFRGPGGDIVGPAVVQGAWTHVAAVQDGVLGTRSLYVNGVLVATGVAQAADGAGDLWIGQQNQPSTFPDSYPGQVDEIRLYNIPVPPSQITNLMGPPALSVVSSVTQGSAGTFTLPLLPSATTAIESRQGSPTGSYKIVLTFSAPVSGLSASLALQNGGAATGVVGAITYDVTNTIVTVPLSGVTNVQALNLHLSGIVPGAGTADVPFDVLWGDVNGDSQVTSADAALITNHIGATMANTTAVYDVNCDGSITSADASVGTVGTFIGVPGISNLALTGTASALSYQPGNEVTHANDNNTTTTRWAAADGTYPNWWQVDLGSTCTLSSTSSYWFISGTRTYQYNVEVSNDPTFGSFTLAANDANNAIVGQTSDCFSPVVTGRYVRFNVLSSKSGGFASAYEFQVFGVPGTGSAPVISTQPNSKTVTAGQQVSFSVGLSSSGPVNYQWMRNGLAIYGATSSSFTIPSASAPNAGGNYTVVVTNAYGSAASNPFSITVNPAVTALSTDTPTMPQWALLLMAVLLLFLGGRLLPRKTERSADAGVA